MKMIQTQKSHAIHATLGIIFLAATACAAQAPQGITISKENRTIAITATDSVVAMADVATVHIGFVAYGPDHDSAYAAGSKTSNAVIAALKSAGVPADTIESEAQNLAEEQPYQLNQYPALDRPSHKWTLTQSWTVRANATDAARILDLAVKAGANQSGSIDWSLKDENISQAEAAGKALQRAHTVAEQMAKGLNVKLGALIFASNETQAEPVRPLPRMMMAEAKAAAPAPPPLAINPRRIEKSATVYAVFAIE
ncbi:MAG TPA: SIMPL domain-containing protein [Acidobacteriaceae bacterium]|nr:SIMPL domain-containing protein [Acidobacteriaceae bacterium]